MTSAAPITLHGVSKPAELEQFKGIEARVQAAFAAGDKVYGDRYTEILIGGWHEAIRQMRRTVLFAAILIVAFLILLDAKSGAELAIGPLKLSNISEVLTLVPAVVAFLAAEMFAFALAAERYKEVIAQLALVLHPTLHENKLHVMLGPPATAPWDTNQGVWGSFRNAVPGRASRVLEASDYSILFVVIIGLLVFIAYAYVELFSDSSTNIVTVSISALVATFFVVRMLALLTDVVGDVS